MSHKSVSALIILMMITVCTPLLAQDTDPQDVPPPEQPRKTFQLLRDSSTVDDELAIEEEAMEVWVPEIRGRHHRGQLRIRFSRLQPGSVGARPDHIQIHHRRHLLGGRGHQGRNAFNPILRLGYNLTNWLSLEALGGVAITEYTSTITNRRSRENKPDATIEDDPPLGEYDSEVRSLLTLQASLNALVYPLSFSNDGQGKWHPYLTAGIGKMWYEMNSNYFDGTSGASDFNFGAGLRLLADKNISVRIEVIAHMNTIEFTPAPYFTTLDEGTVVVPLNEYPHNPDDGSVTEQVVTKYSSQSLTLINWSIGVQGSF